MKFKSLLILVLAFVSLGVSAQTFTTDWQKPEGSYPWFATSADNLNTGAYNPITDKLYVAVRGAGIYIIDPATGAWTDSKMLSTVGIPIVGETGYDKFNYAKIATTTITIINSINVNPRLIFINLHAPSYVHSDQTRVYRESIGDARQNLELRVY